MICLICRQAELIDDLTSVTFERGETRVLIKNVPARICPDCGDAVVDEIVAVDLLNLVESAVAGGMYESTIEYGIIED